MKLPFQGVVQNLVCLGVHAAKMSPSFYRIVTGYHMMLHFWKKRALIADDIRNLVKVSGITGKPINVTTKNRLPWVWVSTTAFDLAPF